MNFLMRRILANKRLYCCNVFQKSVRFKSENKLFYFISTPIFYVNASPHIGHLYSALLADASYRFHRLKYNSPITVFSTGTDEHGTKIQLAAASANMTLPDFCQTVSNEYNDMFRLYDIEYNKFIRTSNSKHKIAVQHFWKELESRGHIYMSKYAGWYCVADESFLTENQLKISRLTDGSEKKVSAESGRPVEWTEEENFKFKLSNFQDDLLYWLKKDDVVKPKKFHKMLFHWIEEGAMQEDISISRPSKRVHWAVPVPENEEQTVYVWLDALVNYLTAVGYPDNNKLAMWPPSVHVVGKDILKFHGIYWPAFLIAAGLEPPSSLLVHSHWTVNGEKMSKSAGNVVSPMSKANDFTASGLRYFLLREGTPDSDSNYNDIKAINFMNAELADTLGNLLNRCTGKIVNAEQKFPKFSADDYNKYCKDCTLELQRKISTLSVDVARHYDNFNFYHGIELIILTLHDTNKFFEVSKPWELCKLSTDEAKHHLDCVLSVTMETLRICSIGLLPIVPKLATAVLDKLGVSSEERTWSHMSSCCFTSEKNNRLESTVISNEKVVIYKRIINK